MADDLSQFFAKKTQKSKEKKKGVIKLDAVGQQLERKVKLQEERDREDEEEERQHQAEEQFLKSRKDPEDSEWLDYNDPNKEIKLAEFGIKDMNFTEQIELYDEEEDQKATPSEPTKTWKVPTSQDENQAPVDLPTPQSADLSQQKYVPAHMRMNRQRGSAATPDINNQELFPSLAAADQMEKHQRDIEKREEQRRMEFNEKQSKLAEERQSAVNMVKQVNPNVYQVVGRRAAAAAEQPSEAPSSSPPPSAAAAAAAAAAANNPNAYVPPHLRKGAASSDRPMEPPPPTRSGGSPWGNRDHSAPAPPPPSTNNRFASLKD